MHEDMPLTDLFGRPIFIVDRRTHERYWLRAQELQLTADLQAVKARIHELKVRKRELEQLKDRLDGESES